MKPWVRWIYVFTWVVAAFVAVSSIVQAIRLGSWTPILAVAWLPAVIVAARPGAYRRCLPRRRRAAG